jgi:hypothetical protein
MVAVMLVLGALVVVAPGAHAAGKNCDDFTYQEDAQAYLRANPSDPDGLDGPAGTGTSGRPGVACEGLPCRAGCDYNNVYAQSTPVPTAAPSIEAAPARTLASSDGSVTATFSAPVTPAPVRRVAVRRATSALANSGPREDVPFIAALAVVLLGVGMRLRGRRAAGLHWL